MGMKEHQRRVYARFLDSINGNWRLRAACDPWTGTAPNPADIPDFEDEELSAQRRAASFCNSACPVVEECRAFALDTGEEWHVWGGLTSTEREHRMKRIRQERRNTA